MGMMATEKLLGNKSPDTLSNTAWGSIVRPATAANSNKKRTRLDRNANFCNEVSGGPWRRKAWRIARHEPLDRKLPMANPNSTSHTRMGEASLSTYEPKNHRTPRADSNELTELSGTAADQSHDTRMRTIWAKAQTTERWWMVFSTSILIRL